MIRLTGIRAEQRASEHKERIIDEYLAVPGGAGLRHRAFIRLAARLIARREWPGFETIENEIRTLGEETERDRAEIESAIRSAQQKITPIPLELPVHKPKKSVRRRFAAQAAQTDAIPVERVSDDLHRDDIRAAKTLLIRGGTGMGKSWTIYDYLNSLPDDQRVTTGVLFYLLTLALVNNIDGAVHYQDANDEYQELLGLSARLVSTVSSLYKFSRAGGVVWFDEAEENLEFLACSNTFTPGERILNFAAFKRLVTTANQLIMTSANLSDITEKWVQTHRPGPITFKRYRPAKPRGKVAFLRDHTAGFCMVEKLLARARGQVWTMHSSEAQAADLADWARERGYRVLKITSDTSQTETVRAAIDNQHSERSAYDLVVITTAAGAGVDVSEPIYAKVGFFSARPLSPRQGIQLFGRVRNAQRSYAVVPPESEGYKTPTADDLLTDRLKRERWTAAHVGMTPHDSGDYLELLQLWAQFTALDLKEKARWRHYFTQRLQAEGFTVVENNASAPEAFAAALDQWRADRQEQKTALVVGATGQALSDDDLENLRREGQEISRHLKLRNVRFKVNEARGDDAMTPLDADLIERSGRSKLFHLRDLLRSEIDLLDEDRQEALRGNAIQKRRYKALNQRVLGKLLSLAGFKVGTVEQRFLMFAGYFKEERSATEVAERFGAFTGDEAMRLFKALGHYGNNAQTVIGLCRWLLDYFGLCLMSRQLRSEGTRMMFYRIDLETFEYRLDRARRANGLSKNVNLEITTTFLDASIPTDILPNETEEEFATYTTQKQLHIMLAEHTVPVGEGYSVCAQV